MNYELWLMNLEILCELWPLRYSAIHSSLASQIYLITSNCCPDQNQNDEKWTMLKHQFATLIRKKILGYLPSFHKLLTRCWGTQTRPEHHRKSVIWHTQCFLHILLQTKRKSRRFAMADVIKWNQIKICCIATEKYKNFMDKAKY